MALILGSGAAASPRPGSWRAGRMFIILFALPFCAASGGLAALAIRRLGEPDADLRQDLLLGIGALTFGGTGFGLIALALRGGRIAAREEELRRLHPQSPWMWRDDWAAGRVEDSSRRGLVLSWVFALFWNLVSAPVLLLLREEVEKKGNRLALLALVFPLVGVALLVHAARASLRWRKFGASLFGMERVPCAMGGTLEGRIHTCLPGAIEDGVRLTLTCVRRFRRGSGRNRTAEEKIVWQEEGVVDRASLEPGPSGADIPVSFAIPSVCPPTDESRPDDAVVWILRAEARVPGVDYLSQFEVPVFRTAESRQAAPEAAERAARSRDRTAALATSGAEGAREVERGVGLEPGSRIRVGPAPGGGVEFYFGAARNPKEAVGITLFLLLWIGVIVLMVRLAAPVFFPVVFGCFGALLLLGAINLWLRTDRVVIEAGEVRVRTRWLGLGRTRTLPAASVRDVKLRIGMQSGGASGRAFYDLALEVSNGRSVVAGRLMRRKREAEWLAFEMKRVLGIRSATAEGARLLTPTVSPAGP